MSNILEINHLTMKFGGLIAIDDVSFSVKKNTITSLIGPNGAGKTTVFNCITGFYKPTVGEILLNSNKKFNLERMNDFTIPQKAKVARTFQNIRLFPQMTVLENLVVAQHNKLMKACKDHATALYSLSKFEYDILGSPLNKKMYTKCVEVFESVGDVYSSVDERDLMIDELKNKITDLQLRLKDAKPYREEVEVLVDLVNQIPSQHIETAEFRILTMLKVFKIAPKNQETKVIGSYETVTGF